MVIDLKSRKPLQPQPLDLKRLEQLLSFAFIQRVLEIEETKKGRRE